MHKRSFFNGLLRPVLPGRMLFSSLLFGPLLFGPLLFALLLVAGRAHAELVVEITKGQEDAIPIAIVPFNPPTEAAASFDVAQLVSDDLVRSGRFRSMDRKDMIDQPHAGASIAFDDWRRLTMITSWWVRCRPWVPTNTTWSSSSTTC